jgi:hypothetical protein
MVAVALASAKATFALRPVSSQLDSGPGAQVAITTASAQQMPPRRMCRLITRERQAWLGGPKATDRTCLVPVRNGDAYNRCPWLTATPSTCGLQFCQSCPESIHSVRHVSRACASSWWLAGGTLVIPRSLLPVGGRRHYQRHHGRVTSYGRNIYSDANPPEPGEASTFGVVNLGRSLRSSVCLTPATAAVQGGTTPIESNERKPHQDRLDFSP